MYTVLTADPITEEMHLEKEWFEQAEKQTVDTLPAFIKHVMNDYGHDYGTVCHAIAACALAAVEAANKLPTGGITGFQAGFVMWDFVRKLNYPINKCGLRIIDYDDFLYPQYQHKHDKVISQATWDTIQRQAHKKLKTAHDVNPYVKAHWQSIVDGNVPFGYSVKEV